MNTPVKKILISYNTARYLYRFRIAIILGLLDRHYKVIVIAPFDSYSQKLEDLGCEVYNIKMDNKGSNPFIDLMTLLEYINIYHRIKPDVALHFTIKPNIYGTIAARLNSVPCINMVTGLGTAFIQQTWLTNIVELLYKLSQKWAYKVFFQNTDDLNLFINRGLISLNKAEQLASSGVNLTQFSATSSIDNPNIIFLFIGRILKDKGVIEFIHAAKLIKKKYPKVRFQLLGQLDVINRTAIARKQIDLWISEGTIEYLGETDNVIPYITKVDCIVLPSYREGLSRTLLEASAMSKPIVATDVTGCREIIDDGINGFLCKVKDHIDLADKLERILNLTDEQRNVMGRAGREKMEKEFDEKIIVKRYLEVVQESMIKISD